MHLKANKHGISSPILAFIYHDIEHTLSKAKTPQDRSEQKHLNIQAPKLHGIQPSILGNLYSNTQMHVHTFYA